MWWKLLLLTLYLILLFFLSRLLETVAYYEAGYLSSRLIDPVSLSVRKLKAILDQRGVSYNGVLERKELKELVKSSGVVSNGALESSEALTLDDDLDATDDEMTGCTNFTCGTHFYEEVEDTKDSVWVVQVHCDRWRHILNRTDWKYFIRKVSRFGVRTGHFDCSLDRRLCERKRWYDTQLILALPVGYQAKDQVIHRSYSGPAHPHNILKWVNRNLASRVTALDTWDQFDHDWLNFDDRRLGSEKIRVVMFSQLDVPPMFFSVLSVKFTGRAKFGMVDMRTRDGEAMAERLNVKPDGATYIILTPENNYTYGYQTGEHMSYESMALLLRTLHPEVNDMFLLSLIVVNLACCLDFFITRGGLLKRFGRVLWVVVKWNFLLILLWLPVLGLFQLPYMTTVLSHVLSLLRRVSLTSFGVSVRTDVLYFSTSVGFAALVATFFVFAVAVGIAHYMLQGVDDGSGSTVEGNGRAGLWWFEWETYASSLLHQSPRGAIDLDRLTSPHPNMDIELLIERLAVPNLWLSPLVSSQYIHSLPVWKYRGPTVESDVSSDGELTEECGASHLDEENTEDSAAAIINAATCATATAATASATTAAAAATGLIDQPVLFMCEKCRALQSITRKSEQQLEQERMQSESACAKYMMDGNYRCTCGGGVVTEPGGTRHRCRSGSTRHRANASSGAVRDCNGPVSSEESDGEMSRTPAGMIAVIDCSICLESYKRSAVLCGLPCGHSFHQQCIMAWLKRDNHCCPICRWPAYKAKPCNVHQHAE